MSQFVKSFFSIIALFVLAFIVLGFFLPKENRIEVKRNIRCTPEVVYSNINDLKKWKTWDPWQCLDPNIKVVYSENPVGEGAWYSWEGNNKVKKGKLSILHSVQNQSVETSLNFDYQGEVPCGFEINPFDNGSHVTWYMNVNYPQNNTLKNLFGGYMYLLFKFMIQKDFNKGLDNLDKLCS